MAITSGAGPHFAWLNVDGATFPIEHGSVEQRADKTTSTFSVALPLSLDDAQAKLSNLGTANEATITVLTRGINATLLTGKIDTTNFDLIGMTIRIGGRDKSAGLQEETTSEKWVNKKPSEIVQDLCGRIGLKCQAETSKLLAGKQVQQDYVRLTDNVTFAQVIHKLAEFDGARWWVDAQGTLHYVISDSPAGIYTLNYTPPSPYIKSDCLRLNINRKIQASDVEVNVNSWNPKDKQVYSKKSSITGSGNSSKPSKYTYDIPNLKQDHVDQYAKSRVEEVAENELTLNASVAGDPSCNAGMDLQLNGTGFWDQKYKIQCVQHEIGMTGHRTAITARASKGNKSAS